MGKRDGGHCRGYGSVFLGFLAAISSVPLSLGDFAVLLAALAGGRSIRHNIGFVAVAPGVPKAGDSRGAPAAAGHVFAEAVFLVQTSSLWPLRTFNNQQSTITNQPTAFP